MYLTKWSYSPYKCPYKWVTRVINNLLMDHGDITPFVTLTQPMAKLLNFLGLHIFSRENKPFKPFFSGSRTAE